MIRGFTLAGGLEDEPLVHEDVVLCRDARELVARMNAECAASKAVLDEQKREFSQSQKRGMRR
jgi:hypothetical protein